MRTSVVIKKNAINNKPHCKNFLKSQTMQYTIWRNIKVLKPSLFIILLLVSFQYLNGQPGKLDATFGINGVTKIRFIQTGVITSSKGASFSIQTGGSRDYETLRVYKYGPDGLPDLSFGTNGVSEDVYMKYRGKAVQDDGRIIIVGETGPPSPIHTQVKIIRFNDYGVIDSNYATVDRGITYRFVTKVVKKAGEIAVFGYGISLGGPGGSNSDFAITENSEKTISPSNRPNSSRFGGFDNFSASKSIAIQGNKIIVAGLELLNVPFYSTANLVGKYLNGAPDPSFGVNGFSPITGGLGRFEHMVLAISGKIFIAYSLSDPITRNINFAIEKFNENGSPDLTYGTNGINLVNFGGLSEVKSIVTYKDKFIVGGRLTDRITGLSSICIASFNDDGTLDTRFGNNGKQTLSETGYDYVLSHLRVEGDRLYAYGDVQDYMSLKAKITAAYQLNDNITINCVSNKEVANEQGLNNIIVTGLDPVLLPVGAVAPFTYTLTGATTGSGSGSASNKSFKKGTTIVTYTLTTEPSKTCSFSVTVVEGPAAISYYSKATGDLHNLQTWGTNTDGSGQQPTNFGEGKIFRLQNRGAVTCSGQTAPYIMTADWIVDGKIVLPNNTGLDINGFTLSHTGIETDFVTANCNIKGFLKADKRAGVILKNIDKNFYKIDFQGAVNNAPTDLKNLTIDVDDTVYLSNPVNLFGVLTLTKGVLTGPAPYNNPPYIGLTLKSNAEGTARVAPLGTGTSQMQVTVERYIPPKRAWRIVGSPVRPNQTINTAWQEGATTTTSNPTPGFGTHITGGSAANGFDVNSSGSSSSISEYNSRNNSWQPLNNTNNKFFYSNAFMLFVRGDRSIPLSYSNVSPTPTVLRSTGFLKEGNQTIELSSPSFHAIANPFASPINFATFTRNNVQNNFYLWDPKLGGVNGVGGYVLLSSNGVGGYYTTPKPVGPISQYVQSGQGFLVYAFNYPANIIIKESDKYEGPSANVFRSSIIDRGIRVALQVKEKDNITSVLDETSTLYDNKYATKVDDLDAIKLPNFNENIGLVRSGKVFMVERRNTNLAADTLFLKLWNLEQKEYLLHFMPENLAGTFIQSATLVDNYLKTSTPIDVNTGTTHTFKVDGNASSNNAQRFMVVLGSTKINGEIVGITAGFKLSPNPVTGKILNIQFINQPRGTYIIKLVNSLGQIILRDQFKHGGGSITIPVRFKNNLLKGAYNLQINNPTTNVKTAIVVISNEM